MEHIYMTLQSKSRRCRARVHSIHLTPIGVFSNSKLQNRSNQAKVRETMSRNLIAYAYLIKMSFMQFFGKIWPNMLVSLWGRRRSHYQGNHGSLLLLTAVFLLILPFPKSANLRKSQTE